MAYEQETVTMNTSKSSALWSVFHNLITDGIKHPGTSSVLHNAEKKFNWSSTCLSTRRERKNAWSLLKKRMASTDKFCTERWWALKTWSCFVFRFTSRENQSYQKHESQASNCNLQRTATLEINIWNTLCTYILKKMQTCIVIRTNPSFQGYRWSSNSGGQHIIIPAYIIKT